MGAGGPDRVIGHASIPVIPDSSLYARLDTQEPLLEAGVPRDQRSVG